MQPRQAAHNFAERLGSLLQSKLKAVSPSVSRLMLDGHVDLVSADRVQGWLIAHREPGTRRRIRIVVDGKVVEELTAEHFRDDLQTAGVGDGHCGFSYRFMPSLSTGGQIVRVLDAETGYELGGSPQHVRKTSASLSTKPRGRGAASFKTPLGLDGYIDVVSSSRVEGWVVAHQLPEERRLVRILLNGEPMGEVLADQFRMDLKKADFGRGHGRYAFSFKFSETLNFGEHTVKVLDAETGYELRNSPKIIRVTEEMRVLAEADNLRRFGRCREALALLSGLESSVGASYQTWRRIADLNLYLGNPEQCVEACTDALIMLPLGREGKKSATYSDLARLRTEALCLMGRHEEARIFFLGVLENQVPTNADLVILRQAIKTPDSLRFLFNYLAPFFHYRGHRARLALYHFSMACRDNGEINRAILCARQRFLSGLDIVRYGQRAVAPSSDWMQDASNALLDLRAALEENGLSFFLISGTLLGCVREGGIIGHDKDIDVGVMIDRSYDELKLLLAKSGHFKVRPLLTEYLIQVRHANGVMIDVFLHWRENDLVFHQGMKTKWWNSDFELTDAEFLGHKFSIPKDSERYLAENYGSGWRVPDKEFETFVDTPNMIVEDEKHMIWYYYTRLHDYYYEGKYPQFRKVWNALRSMIFVDSKLQSAIDRVVKEAEQYEALKSTD